MALMDKTILFGKKKWAIVLVPKAKKWDHEIYVQVESKIGCVSKESETYGQTLYANKLACSKTYLVTGTFFLDRV